MLSVGIVNVLAAEKINTDPKQQFPDPDELTNLAQKNPEKTAKFAAELSAWSDGLPANVQVTLAEDFSLRL